MSNTPLEKLSWSTVLFKPGRPLLETELNLAQDLAEYKRKNFLSLQVSSGFIRKNQLENPLSDFEKDANSQVTSIKSSTLIYNGEFYLIPQLSLDASINTYNKTVLFYLRLKEEEVTATAATDTVPDSGYTTSGTTVISNIYRNDVGMPTAVRKQLQYSLETDLDYGYHYFNGISNYTPDTTSGLLKHNSDGSYAVPLCLVFRRGSSADSFSATNLTGYNGHVEDKLTGIYIEDILDLRQHVYLPQFSFEQTLEHQTSLLFNNSLKTWAVSSEDMGLPSGSTSIVSEISTTPLVYQSLPRDSSDTYKTFYSDVPVVRNILYTDLANLPSTTGHLYSINTTDIVFHKNKYSLDFVSGFSSLGLLSSDPEYIQIKLNSGGSAKVSLLSQTDFNYFNSRADKKLFTIAPKAAITPQTDGSYNTSLLSVVYRAVAPQALGSAQPVGFNVLLDLVPVYTPEFIYICAASRYSRNRPSDYVSPSEQVPLALPASDKNILAGAGSLIGASYAVEDGFMKIPLLKKSGLLNTFEVATKPAHSIDSQKRALLSYTGDAFSLQAESLKVPASRKVFYPFLAKVTSSSSQLCEVGDLMLVVLSTHTSDITNSLTNTDANFTVSVFKTQGLWKVV
jgi:hypothetical protein